MTIIQVIFVTLSMVGVYFVKNKKRIGWLFWDVSNIFAIIALVQEGAIIMTIPYFYYVYMNTTAWIKWREK